MPTTRQAVAGTKRQKTSSLTRVDAAECVTYDALVDEHYPLDRIEEHLLRLLTYESTEGIGEIIALSLRSAGCNVEFSITGVGASAGEMVSEAESIEESCLHSPAGYPSNYDMLRNVYAKRVRSLLTSTVAKLSEADNADVMLALAKYTAVLSTTRLQSLRFTATVFTGCLAEAVGTSGTAMAPLQRALNERAADVAPSIRKAAITELCNVGDISPALRAFNDPVGSVRLSAVRALTSMHGDVSLEDGALQRIYQLAQQDVELGVRRNTLKFLTVKGLDYDIDLTNMLVDADAQSRNSAAVFIVTRLAREADSAFTLLVDLASNIAEILSSAFSGRASSAVVFALERQKKFKANWLEELGNLLTRDLLKESRSGRVSTNSKKQLRSLAQRIDNVDMQRHLLTLFSALASTTGSASGTALLNALPRLLLKLRYDDDLLAQVLSATSYLPSEKLLGRPDSEQQIQLLFRQILELLAERTTAPIANAASRAFAVLPDSQRLLMLRDAYHDLRLRLATYLGPRGEVNAQPQTSMNSVIMQLLVMARFVDISDLAKLPLWPMLMNGSAQMRQLVRALGMKGSAEVAEQCVEKLLALPSGPAIDEILQIYVSAKMRGVELGRLPFDINEQPPTKETVWTAAVAAGVI